MNMTPVVALDTETDGVHPGRQAWEVAMVRRDDDGQREIQFFLDIDLSTADPFGLKVGGFYDRHPLGQWLSGVSTARPMVGVKREDSVWSLRDAADTIARWTHGAHVIGAVPNFDTEVIGGLLRSQGLIPAHHYHLIDVEALTVGYLAGRAAWGGALRAVGLDDDAGNAEMACQYVNQLPWNSDELSRACGVEPPSKEDRHTALADAWWALSLYDTITGGAA